MSTTPTPEPSTDHDETPDYHETCNHDDSSLLTSPNSHTKTHGICRRCGRRSMHNQTHVCAGCGYPAAKTRKCTFYRELDHEERQYENR